MRASSNLNKQNRANFLYQFIFFACKCHITASPHFCNCLQPSGWKKEYHFKICLSSLFVCPPPPPLYMENTVQPIKVVETDNFLMYVVHECTNVWSFHTVFMSSCIYFWCTSFVVAHLKVFDIHAPREKVHKCLHWRFVYSFLKGLQWMCATHVCQEFWPSKQRTALSYMKYVYIRHI